MSARRWPSWVGAALVAGSAVLTAGAVRSARPLVIGLLLPPQEADAASLRDGVLLGVARANAGGQRPVRLVIRGRNGPWGSDATEAARLVTEDGASGLIAPSGSGATHLVLQVAGRTAVPVVSLCADASVTRTGVPWMARIVPSAIDEARVLFSGLDMGRGKRGRRWVAVVPAGREGRQATVDLREAASEAQAALGRIIIRDPKAGAVDWVGKQVLKAHPDAVLIWLDCGAAARLTRRLRAARFTGILAGPGWLRAAHFTGATGPAAEGFVVPALAHSACARLQSSFALEFRQRFGRAPGPKAAMACDAATLLARVLRNAGPRAARLAFPLTAPLRGVTGPLRFGPQGDRLVGLELRQWRGEQFIKLVPHAPPGR